MNDIAAQVGEFLDETFTGFGFHLKVNGIEPIDEGFLLDITGNDVSLLLNEGGELLDVFEYLTNQIHGAKLERGQRFICDAESFRQTRKAELRAMARFAAENVRKNGKSFTFGKLTANERRLIHLALEAETDLQTESVGEKHERRLQVRLKSD